MDKVEETLGMENCLAVLNTAPAYLSYIMV
jgi:hypothetical protein